MLRHGSKLLNTGLVLLMAGLFATAVTLNRNQYVAANANAGNRFERELQQQAKDVRQKVGQQETALFNASTSPIPLGDNAIAAQAAIMPEPTANAPATFVILPARVVPACTAGLLETVSVKEAKDAFEKGLAVWPDPSALPHFRIASKSPVETADDLYRKIGALFNVLELDPTIDTACCLLTLIQQTSPALSESKRSFFDELLKEQVPNLDRISKWLKQQQATAKLIDTKLTRKKGAYRMGINGKILTVREDGLAILYSPRLEAVPPVEITHSSEAELQEEIIPGVHAAIPTSVITNAKQDIRRQYRTGNTILALLAVLGAMLAGGMHASATHRRKLDEARTQFIATVSHELRTPLSLIRLHAETLKHGRVPEGKEEDYHQTILTEAERLTGIVNNVLDFSRMERGKMELHPEEANLSELTEQAASAFNDRLARERFTLEREIQPNVIGIVDPLAYSQIAFNLLDNAIKYSGGAKTIRIGLVERDAWNILTVADQGIGIPDKLKKHIFDEFVRSDDSKVTARRGSGIGLSVAKRLAEQMGGTIEVENNQPEGTVFTLSVPPASSGLQGRQDGGDTKGNDETTGG